MHDDAPHKRRSPQLAWFSTYFHPPEMGKEYEVRFEDDESAPTFKMKLGYGGKWKILSWKVGTTVPDGDPKYYRAMSW